MSHPVRIIDYDSRTGFTPQSTLDKALSLADLIVWKC
jgi:hypothetical protein